MRRGKLVCWFAGSPVTIGVSCKRIMSSVRSVASGSKRLRAVGEHPDRADRFGTVCLNLPDRSGQLRAVLPTPSRDCWVAALVAPAAGAEVPAQYRGLWCDGSKYENTTCRHRSRSNHHCQSCDGQTLLLVSNVAEDSYTDLLEPELFLSSFLPRRDGLRIERTNAANCRTMKRRLNGFSVDWAQRLSQFVHKGDGVDVRSTVTGHRVRHSGEPYKATG